MKRLIYILIFIIFTICIFSANYENSYLIKVNGIKSSNNYYTKAKYYFINNDSSKFLPHTFYIKFKNNSADNSIFNFQFNQQTLNIKSIKQPFLANSQNEFLLSNTNSLSRIYQVYFDNDINPFYVCNELNKNPNVEYAVPVFRQRLLNYKPNDTYLASQWGLKKILAEQGWDITKGDSTVIIGLVDSGTDIDHNDLKNKVKINYNEIPNDKIDNDNNGFIDDYYGWDFVGNIAIDDALQNNYKPDNNPKPLFTTNSHGTHTAGIIAAETDNSLGVAGIAIKNKFIPVKVAMDNMEAPKGSADIFFGFEAIIYCMQRGCGVINLSWEVMGYSPVEEEIIDFVTQSRVILVASAGNDNHWTDKYKTYPAQYKNVISVGSTDEFDKKSSFSQFGYNVDIYAPGSMIYSTLPSNNYGNKSGTSMAAPFVTGAVALLKSIHKDWTTEEVRHQLRATCDNVITTNPTLYPFFIGRLNLLNLLKYNNDIIPEFTKPGISVSEIQIEGADEINSFDTVNVKFIIKNYLATTSDISINIETGDLFVNVYDKQHTISYFPEKSEVEINVKMRITNRNLWFNGNAVLTVNFSGKDYHNYQLVEIPISLPTDNKFFVAYDFTDDFGLQFFAGDSKDDYSLSAIGNSEGSNSAGFLLKYGSTVKLVALPTIANCIFSLSENEDLIGSKGKIYIVSQGGTKAIDVSAIADNVYGIHFFDENNGFLGGIKSNRIVIGKSTDAGKSWSKLNIPSFIGSEAHISDYKLFSVKDSIIYFGSKSGKIAFTSDYGNTWQTSTVGINGVEFLSVANINSSIALVYDANDEQYQVWKSNQNGISWTKFNSNLASFQSNPVYTFSPDSSDSYIILGSHNEVYRSLDSSKNWAVVLSQEYNYNGNIGGTGFLKKDGRIRLWNFSSDLTFLDFDNYPTNMNKNLSYLSDKIVDFGEIYKDSALTKFLFFKNNGNYRVNIEKVIINPLNLESADKFTIDKPLTNSVASGAIENIQIKFSSNIKGDFKARLEVYSDADTSIHKIELIATAIDTTGGSFIDLLEKSGLKLIKQDNKLFISSDEIIIKSIHIYNIQGQKLASKLNLDKLNCTLDIENFAKGIYFAEIIFNSQTIVIPFLIGEN